MENQLSAFIMDKNFPCIMAKSVFKNGFLNIHEITTLEDENVMRDVLEKFYIFIDNYRRYPNKLSSFIITIKNAAYKDFSSFETNFWMFLKTLHQTDKKKYVHDSRVSSDPEAGNFGFSVKEEAFFILALHPKSPRLARRFFSPAIVFNPHQQFEAMRKNGMFKKVRNIIRKRDELLQGSFNPMLEDFGEKSEVFQYLGKTYEPEAPCPLIQ